MNKKLEYIVSTNQMDILPWFKCVVNIEKRKLIYREYNSRYDKEAMFCV